MTGAEAALPIWVDFMKEINAGRPSQAFQAPPGVVEVTVDPASGEVAHAGCPTQVTEVFIAGTEPNTFCPLHSHASVGGRTTLTPHQALPHEITSPTPARPEATSP
jgi:penicillin-binding protein 1A